MFKAIRIMVLIPKIMVGVSKNNPINNIPSQLKFSLNGLNYANLTIPYKTGQIYATSTLYFPLADNYQILTSTAITITLPLITQLNCGIKVWFYRQTTSATNVSYAPFTGNYLQDFNSAPLAVSTTLTSASFAKCFLSSSIIVASTVAYGWVCISNA